MQNPYLPYPVRIDEITTETEDKNLKTFKLVFINPEDEEKFNYQAGQFAELSVAGKGEIPIGIASSPTEKGFLMFTVNKVGLVTSYLHNMKAGDIMGVRGPLGNWYPLGYHGRQEYCHHRRRVCFYDTSVLHYIYAGSCQPTKI